MSFYLYNRLANGPSIDLLYHSNIVEYVVWCQLFNHRQAAPNHIILVIPPICKFISIG